MGPKPAIGMGIGNGGEEGMLILKGMKRERDLEWKSGRGWEWQSGRGRGGRDDNSEGKEKGGIWGRNGNREEEDVGRVAREESGNGNSSGNGKGVGGGGRNPLQRNIAYLARIV